MALFCSATWPSDRGAGNAFNPENAPHVGSPALLLFNQLAAKGARAPIYEPHIDSGDDAPNQPAVYVIATKHERFESWLFPTGSLVLDPCGYVPDKEGATVIRLGRTAISSGRAAPTLD